MKPQPLRGHAIIGFTAEQVATYNVRLFGDKEFVISDQWNPDFHSIEEGVIISVSKEQTELQPGQNVLVDYAIFTAGRHKDRQRDNTSRKIGEHDGYHLYWCYDDMHPWNSAEIFAVIDDTGKVKAFGDAVIIYPHDETEALIEIVTSVKGALSTQFPGVEKAVVLSSPVAEISDGDMIIHEKGLSPAIFYRGIEMQYINLPYIYGIVSPDHPYSLKLF